jgi:hypothetical protein
MPRRTAAAASQPDPDFDLDKLIVETLRTSSSADPEDLADEILPRIPVNELRSIVRLILPERIKSHIRSERSQPPRTGRRKSSRWLQAADSRDSGEMEEIRTELLARRYGRQGARDWRALADIDAEFAEALAEYHSKLSVANASKAAQFDALRKALNRRHLTVASELPTKVLLDIFES